MVCGGYLQETQKVTQAAEEALDEIVAVANSKLCLEILTGLVRAEEPPILQATPRVCAMCLRTFLFARLTHESTENTHA